MTYALEGEIVDEFSDSEPWEFYVSVVRRSVEGHLADRVRARVNRPEGIVESVERNYSAGTCELCGYGEEGITILVDSCVVFAFSGDDGSYYYPEEAPEITNPFTVLSEWLDGNDEYAVDFAPYTNPTNEEEDND